MSRLDFGRRLVASIVLALALGDANAASRTVSAGIYRGQVTKAYPAVASIEIRNLDDTVGFCSGTLIAPTVVLTAGHCLAFGPASAQVAVQPDGVTFVVVDVARWEVHPNFDLDRIAVADVAALVLATPLAVTPVPMVSAPLRQHLIGTIIGFGDDAVGGTGVKRAGRVRLSRCPRAVRRIGIAPGQLSGSLCWRPHGHGQDTCHGDSGGPLIVDGLLAGVTSGGFPECPGRLSWDTSVLAVRSWIDDVIARATIGP